MEMIFRDKFDKSLLFKALTKRKNAATNLQIEHDKRRIIDSSNVQPILEAATLSKPWGVRLKSQYYISDAAANAT
jgi:hypothetical protein